MNSPISVSLAKQLKGMGYRFCIRYLPRMASRVAGNVTRAEAQGILDAGLALTVVQHVPPEGWIPDAKLGANMGAFAGMYAQRVAGLPGGINIWCDLEGVNATASVTDIQAFCNSWYLEVKKRGFIPGIYVGYQTGLTNEQLGALPFQHFWQGYNGPDVAGRGVQLQQSTGKVVNGVFIDPNKTQNDSAGGKVIWAVK
jgi:hypothetical protein